jgi:hypothetical protein
VTYHEVIDRLLAVGLLAAALVVTAGPLLLGRALAGRKHGYTLDADAPTEGPSYWGGFDVATRARTTLDPDTVVLEPTPGDVTDDAPRVPSDAELFFAADPLGSESLPVDLELPNISTDVFVDLMNAGVLSPRSGAPVSAAWVGWGMLDDAAARDDVDDELARIVDDELVAA